ncbi:terminase large subunit domain-containing protein [Agrococcus casei]|uniref:Phage Terminase n=1 Tax=Agrococcus casei LMG 22410 TaxID=1255656 RepID=A0A1R4GF99_9MICO|nr:terminase large subunit [Agrococcus casei]SJM66858.1 Phage Terminase [Agrococcus casei LMG 22410]
MPAKQLCEKCRSSGWPPTRHSPPLSEEFPSHGDWLLKLIDLVWRTPDGTRLNLDEYQRHLIRHVLEVYPADHARAGRLRYRQVVISLARQNGKSVIGSIFALYGLLREAGALVIGIASSSEQARIIYKRLMAAIDGDKRLRRRFARLTDTRGISSHDGGVYEIKPSKSAAVQGLDVSVGLADELHILPAALWTDMVNGSRARRNGIVIGYTTAGNDESELLLRLYEDTEDPNIGERFGYFIWEAPEVRVPDDRHTRRHYILEANPAAADGRLDAEDILDDIETMPEHEIVRYVFNRFGASSSTFITAAVWQRVRRPAGSKFPRHLPAWISIDRTPEWSWASIVASVQDDDGIIWTEVVASLERPDVDMLERVAHDLGTNYGPAGFIMDALSLGELADRLKGKGYNVIKGTLGHATNAATRFYARIATRTLQHAGDALLDVQIPRAVRKDVGESFRISRKDSSVEVDTTIATAYGVLAAETSTRHAEVQVF